ncbi:uncharacterized protein [Argopecten irradians]|uniref:uncharacterized protein n=1 Tax=Argopecten irradians TaxID=31199 RepID=UPI003716B047
MYWPWSLILLLEVPFSPVSPSIGPFDPGKSIDDQPQTFSPPIPNLDCSIYNSRTYWHYINSSSGRCCRQIFVHSGMFAICENNGESDKPMDCPSGLHNWKNPSYSGHTQWPIDSKYFCSQDEGVSPLNISWTKSNYTTEEGRAITLYGEVGSTSELVSAYMFRNGDDLPVGEMIYRKTGVTNKWYTEHSVRHPTVRDSGVYRILVTNNQISSWSPNVTLTVFTKKSTTTAKTSEVTTTRGDALPITTYKSTTISPLPFSPHKQVTLDTSEAEVNGLSGYFVTFLSIGICLLFVFLVLLHEILAAKNIKVYNIFTRIFRREK